MIAETADESRSLVRPIRNVLAVGLGNALEFYDFLTFSFFAIQIGHSFFPDTGAGRGLLYSLAIFGVGFVTRPLGGLVIGIYGDRAGRKPALLLSFALMGGAIVCMALIPPYGMIGIAAPILLVVCRLVQGFALGGEVGPSTAYMIEAAPLHRRGLYVALQGMTQEVAVLAAGLAGFGLSSVLAPEALDDWGWRVAFLLGAAVVPLGLVLRRSLPETLHTPVPATVSPSRRVPVRLVAVSLMILGSGTVTAYMFAYMATYAQDSLHLSPKIGFAVTIVEGLVALCVQPLAGIVSDRLGRRPVSLAGKVLLLVCALPGYLILNRYPSAGVLYAVAAILTLFAALSASTTAIGESLPRGVRSGALSIIYAVAISVFGGSAQVVAQWLIGVTGSRIAPAWYWTATLAIGALGIIMMPESAPARTGETSDRV